MWHPITKLQKEKFVVFFLRNYFDRNFVGAIYLGGVCLGKKCS